MYLTVAHGCWLGKVIVRNGIIWVAVSDGSGWVERGLPGMGVCLSCRDSLLSVRRRCVELQDGAVGGCRLSSSLSACFQTRLLYWWAMAVRAVRHGGGSSERLDLQQ